MHLPSRVLAVALISVATACGGGGGSSSSNGPIPNTGQGWTVLVYMVADNDLEPFGLLDLQEMGAVGSGNDLRIIVQADRAVGYAAGGVLGVGDWTSAKRFEVGAGYLREVQDLGEVDMSSPGTLADFVQWGLKTYPGQKTMLVLWDHGGGWAGFGVDEQAGGFMNLASIASGISAGLAQVGAGVKLDAIGFDACLMATFEVAESLKGSAGILIASQESEPGHGWDYRGLAGAGGLAAPALGQKLASAFKAQAQDPQFHDDAQITLSVVDLGKLGPIETALHDLALTYPDAGSVAPVLTSLGSGRARALEFGANPDPSRATQLVDLSDLFAGSTGVSGAAAIQAAVAGAVLYEVTGAATSSAHGLSIYFPRDPSLYKTGYSSLPGTADWRSFLDAVFGGGAAAPQPTFDPATLQATAPASLEMSGDVTAGTIAGLADAYLAYGLPDGGTGAYLFGQNEASLSGSTVTGSWDWSVMRMSQGAYQEFGYLVLRSAGAGKASATIPLVYEEGGVQGDAMRVIVFDATSVLSDTTYLFGPGGTLGELTPQPGSRLRAVVAHLADATSWSPTWELFDGTAAGFDATAGVALDFPQLDHGASFYASLRIENAAQQGDMYPVADVRP